MNKHAKYLLVSPSPLSSQKQQCVLDALRILIVSRYLAAAELVQVQWSSVPNPTDRAALLDHCHHWADSAWIIVEAPAQCLPIEGIHDQALSRSPVHLAATELEPRLWIQDLTQYKHGLLKRWLDLNLAFEALSFEATIIEPTTAQLEALQFQSTSRSANSLKTLLTQHSGKFVVVDGSHQFIAAASTLDGAELIAQNYLDRCNIYGPDGNHLTERWYGR